MLRLQCDAARWSHLDSACSPAIAVCRCSPHQQSAEDHVDIDAEEELGPGKVRPPLRMTTGDATESEHLQTTPPPPQPSPQPLHSAIQHHAMQAPRRSSMQ